VRQSQPAPSLVPDLPDEPESGKSPKKTIAAQ
jgi:hypothetical protein